MITSPRGPAGASHPHIVSLRPGGGTRPPLLLVSGQSGFAFIFQQLARAFDAEQPVLACQLLGVDPDEPLAAYSVEQMADVLEAEVLAACAQGPIVLGGYSMGAYIAFELAHRLQARGREVPMLISLDAFAPPYPPMGGLLRRTQAHVDAIRRDPQAYAAARAATSRRLALRAIGREWQSLRDIPALDPKTMERVKRLAVLRRESARRYRPSFRVDGPLLLFRTPHPNVKLGSVVGASYGWERHVSGEISVHMLTGDHDTLLYSAANQRLIADRIGARIDAIARLGR